MVNSEFKLVDEVTLKLLQNTPKDFWNFKLLKSLFS